MCRSKSGNNQSQRSSRRAHYVQEDPDSKEDHAYTMFTFKDPAAEPICQEVSINNVPIKMEVDTGASVSVVSQETYQIIRGSGHTQQLQPSEVRLKTYTGETIGVLGQLPVEVRYGETDYKLVVQVVRA